MTEVKDQYNETSKIIQRTILTILSFSLFCLLSLGEPDLKLITTDTIKLPIIGTDISFISFLIVGPLLLVGLYLYLHIYLSHMNTFEEIENISKLPFIFNLKAEFAKLLSQFIFYWLLPIILFCFTWKALPRPILEVSFLLLLYFFSSIFLLFTRIKQNPKLALKTKFLFVLAYLFPAFLLITDYYNPYNKPILRQLNLFQANLERRDLRGYNFKYANLAEANLRKAKLNNSNFRGAILESADLQDSDLSYSILRDTNLIKANLENSNLRYSLLRNANLSGANLKKANLSISFLKDAKLIYANLGGANLENANLEGVDLTGAELKGANLSGAQLKAAVLTDVDFEGIDLSNTSGIDDILIPNKSLKTDQNRR